MKIIIPGGIGQVGGQLTIDLLKLGHDVIVLTRNPRETSARAVYWDGRSLGPWADELDGSDVLINLAGKSVNCRYHEANRRLLVDSRILSTRVLGEAIARCKRPPRAWLQASTATIYEHRFDAPNDELTGILGGHEPNLPDTWRFSYDLANAWEKACLDAPTPHTRKVLLRAAMVMNHFPAGTFDILRLLTRLRLGGPVAGGRQFMSWIHARDFSRTIQWIIDHEQLAGPVNIASPNPLPQAEFMQALREASGVRLGLPATRWMVEVGVFLMRSESELILKSRRVVPRKLLDSGFTFEFPHWNEAARDLCAT